jgi:hypothetical protein
MGGKQKNVGERLWMSGNEGTGTKKLTFMIRLINSGESPKPIFAVSF